MLVAVEATEQPKPSPSASTPANRPPAKEGKPARSSRPAQETESAGVGPKYLAFHRKEARFTADQLSALDSLTRELNQRRRGKGERITDNTLIRVAVDLLLSRSDDLAGITEDELRHSVSL